MWHTLLPLYWVPCFHCHNMYDKLLLLGFGDMSFFTCIFVILYFIIDTSILMCINFFCKFMIFHKFLLWTLIQLRFEFTITSSPYFLSFRATFEMWVKSKNVWVMRHMFDTVCVKWVSHIGVMNTSNSPFKNIYGDTMCSNTFSTVN